MAAEMPPFSSLSGVVGIFASGAGSDNGWLLRKKKQFALTNSPQILDFTLTTHARVKLTILVNHLLYPAN